MTEKRRPYFDQGGVTIYHGACVDVLAEMAPRSVGLFISDPPYVDAVHVGARSNKGRRGYGKDDARGRRGGSQLTTGRRIVQAMRRIDFKSFSHDDMAAAFGAIGRVASRWVVATTAFEHAGRMCEAHPAGLKFIRCGSWVKNGPTPQMTGDRPGQGWEAISILHADDGERMRWNGGGKSAVYRHQAEMRGEYPTQKPEPLIMDFLADFGEPGDLVCDPFMGSGTTLLCAWKRGHLAIGCDIREKACEIAAKRIEAAMRQGRMDFTPAPKRSDQSTLAFE